MKIYFAGSVRGGRDDMESYLEIIHKLQKFGNVLTEHIGDKNLNKLGENKKGDFIRKRDLDWIRESDAVGTS